MAAVTICGGFGALWPGWRTVLKNRPSVSSECQHRFFQGSELVLRGVPWGGLLCGWGRVDGGMRRARLRGRLILQVDHGQVFEQVRGSSDTFGYCPEHSAHHLGQTWGGTSTGRSWHALGFGGHRTLVWEGQPESWTPYTKVKEVLLVGGHDAKRRAWAGTFLCPLCCREGLCLSFCTEV